jgi:cytochrome c oxidase subunit 2
MRHAQRIIVIWIVVSVLVELFVWLAPIPSPMGSVEATDTHRTIYLLLYLGAPIFALVWVLLAYGVIAFRQRPAPDVEEPAPSDPTVFLPVWAIVSLVVVLFLAAWGSFSLRDLTAQPATAASHATRPLEIQAIGREWVWQFRYPSYGGMETRGLFVPVDTPIHLHITSLDVVHSLWIYDYGLKEDAVPGVDNTVWMLPNHTSAYAASGTNWVKCNELCGRGHPYMHTRLFVLTRRDFGSWASKQFTYEMAIGTIRILPRYAHVYTLGRNYVWPPAPRDQFR